MDANLNRAKEGLRVCEDICRFVWDQKNWTGRFKDVRHQLTAAVAAFGISNLIRARDVGRDIGKKTISPEMKRGDVDDIFFANVQRVKESLRVLEEFSKIKHLRAAEGFKKLRYQVYALERKIIKGCQAVSYLRRPGQ
jgi:thiamine-phosphate pyrophosphorylase